MKPNQKYRITTVAGTDLTFESREWHPLDFEICTAPQEDTINGTIVVDGAVFFQRVTTSIILQIHDGICTDIAASSPSGMALANDYKSMTANVMRNPANIQLAEIGIGFCGGAAISDCFMEAEAAANTCHFCFGNNRCYGGINASDFHGASVLIQNPHFERL